MTSSDLRSAELRTRRSALAQEHLATSQELASARELQVRELLSQWDLDRRRLQQQQREVSRQQVAAVQWLQHLQAGALRAMDHVKPALEAIDPSRVKGSRLMAAVRPAAAEWRRECLHRGWRRWRDTTVASRAEDAVLEKQATQLQALYRGFSVRKMKALTVDADEMDKAAGVITRFLRLVAQRRAEERDRDLEQRAIAIQRAVRAASKGKESRVQLRRRIMAALAVMGGGSTSKVLRGVGWGASEAPVSGGFGIYKEPWAQIGAAQAGVSDVKPKEAALPESVRDRMQAYFHGLASNGDCFVLARALFILGDVGGTTSSDSYSLLELARTAKQVEKLVAAVQHARKAKLSAGQRARK